MPLLTLEQLKIRENTSNQNRNIKSYGLIKTTELKDHEDAKRQKRERYWEEMEDLKKSDPVGYFMKLVKRSFSSI